MDTPEKVMKKGFEHFHKANEYFTDAIVLYSNRNNFLKADNLNAANVKKATLLMAQAFDEISAIWGNDINV